MNLYGFGENDPTDSIDPFGLDKTNDPSKKILKEVGDAAKCAKQACKDAMKVNVGGRGPLPGSMIGGASTAVGGALVGAGSAAAQTAPGVLLIAAIRKACKACQDCIGEVPCNAQEEKACQDACAYCEKMKARASNH